MQYLYNVSLVQNSIEKQNMSSINFRPAIMDKPESPKASQYRMNPERRIVIRPQSARPKKAVKDGGSPVPPLDHDRPRRPWSAQPKSRSDMSARRVMRANQLRKPHMRPPVRVTPVDTAEDAGLSVMGLDTQAMLGFTPQTYQLPATTPAAELDQEVRTLVSGMLPRCPLFLVGGGGMGGERYVWGVFERKEFVDLL